MSMPTTDDILRVLNSNASTSRPPGTFEVALVLGGTVSAGAYTAGFLDKLIEALDAWYLAKANDEEVPSHDVKVRVAAGASGGGVCAAILARALAFSFPHISSTSPEFEWDRNPFYKTWVQDLDIAGFVETNDIDAGQPLKSLLNGKAISQATKAAADFRGDPLPAGWPRGPTSTIHSASSSRSATSLAYRSKSTSATSASRATASMPTTPASPATSAPKVAYPTACDRTSSSYRTVARHRRLTG